MTTNLLQRSQTTFRLLLHLLYHHICFKNHMYHSTSTSVSASFSSQTFDYQAFFIFHFDSSLRQCCQSFQLRCHFYNHLITLHPPSLRRQTHPRGLAPASPHTLPVTSWHSARRHRLRFDGASAAPTSPSSPLLFGRRACAELMPYNLALVAKLRSRHQPALPHSSHVEAGGPASCLDLLPLTAFQSRLETSSLSFAARNTKATFATGTSSRPSSQHIH